MQGGTTQDGKSRLIIPGLLGRRKTGFVTDDNKRLMQCKNDISGSFLRHGRHVTTVTGKRRKEHFALF